MTDHRQDRPEYLAKKALLARTLTIFGRKPVLEALEDSSLNCSKLHLADSNAHAPILDQLQKLAQKRGIPVVFHDKRALSRISKNTQQDQGVALDIECPGFGTLDDLLALAANRHQPRALLAVDGVTNPQNLGMIIRSATAGYVEGILLGSEGTADLGPLVVKASAGTLFKARLSRVPRLADALQRLREAGASIYTLSSHADASLLTHSPQLGLSIYVLGNESEGVSPAVERLATGRLSIPMKNGVESLNVAVTAGIIAFLPSLACASSQR